MAYRLIFTSSARSLTGSRTGFCTVARSKNMSEKLAGIVERCGAYDHENMQKSPVFSHRIILFANTSYHILTRVSDAGADYTNRSNYIAEHIVLNEDEVSQVPSGAQFLLDKNDWLTSWQGEPKFLEDIVIKKSESRFNPPSENWQQIFNDPAKAALLLEQNPIIFAKPQDANTLLKLFAESSALLADKSKIWDYTFTTALQHGENPSDFIWKVETNPNFDKLQACDSAINLIAKSAPPAPDTPAAKYAKTAKMSNRDRFGLKVASPEDIKPQIHIANIPAKKIDSTKLAIILASALVTIIALIVAFFVLISDSKQSSNFEPNELYLSGTANIPNAIPVSEIYKKLRVQISGKINNNKWQEALLLWDNSSIKDYNPNARIDILNEIAKRTDSLMTKAQELLGNPQSDLDEPQAVEIMHSVADALEIKTLPKRNELLNRWKNIEKEIKKL